MSTVKRTDLAAVLRLELLWDRLKKVNAESERLERIHSLILSLLMPTVEYN